MTNQDEHKKFMMEAIQLAHQNVDAVSGGPFGCVITHNGKVIGRGQNSVTTNNDPTAHAEVMAIREACQALNTFKLEDCILYTSCEPCPMCLSAIYWAHIPVVYYSGTKVEAAKAGFDDDFIYHELNKDISDRSIKMIGLLHEEANSIFQDWVKSETKIPY